MDSLQGMLIRTFNFLFASAIKRMLSGAGLALFSSASILVLVNKVVSFVVENLNNAPVLMLNFIGISGLDVAISMMLGAMIARATIMQTKLYLGVAQDG